MGFMFPMEDIQVGGNVEQEPDLARPRLGAHELKAIIQREPARSVEAGSVASGIVRIAAAGADDNRLAHDLRLRVFRMLVVAGPDGLTPGTIAAQLDVPNATLSFHLKELMNAGLVTQERDGRSLIYRAAYARMNEVLAYLTSNCCQGQSCLDECKC